MGFSSGFSDAHCLAGSGQTYRDLYSERKSYIISGVSFEWSDFKEELNARDHGFSLSMVEEMFKDPLRIDRRDDEHSGLEERRQTLAKVGKVLFAVYTEKGDIIRVFSLRKASPREKRIYYGTINEDGWSVP